MSDPKEFRGEFALVDARVYVRECARQLGFSQIDCARLATATSELVRNIHMHADLATALVRIRCVIEGERQGLELLVCDAGPGIPDVELAMQEGYSSNGSMGMGLPGARRLMDEFAIESAPGAGTRIVCRKWLRA